MSSPANMKQGTARNMNESAPTTVLCTKARPLMPDVLNKTYTIVLSAIEYAIGNPIANRTKSRTIMTTIIWFQPFLSKGSSIFFIIITILLMEIIIPIRHAIGKDVLTTIFIGNAKAVLYDPLVLITKSMP